MTTEVSELFRLGRGRVISGIEIANNPGNYPVYSSQTKNDGCMGYLSSYDFEGELITWTTDGANAGTVFYRSGKFNCTNVCGTIEAKDKEVTNTKFFSYLLGTLTKRHVSYIGNPKLMNGVMAKIKVHYPDFKHQSAIAKILDTLDITIRQTEAIITKLQQVKQGLLHDLLTRGIDANGQLRLPVEQAPHLYKESPLGWIPREWEVVTLGEVAKRSNGLLQTGPFGSQLHAHDYVTEGVPVIMPQDMVDGLLSEAQIARISERKANVLSRHRVKENDVVFSRRGDLSRCVAIPTEKNGWLCGTGCLLARFSPKEINGYWLSLVYQQPQLQTQVMGRAVGSTMANLNTSILSELVIGRSSIDEQNEIARQVNAANQRLTEENRKLRKLHKQKSALMDDLLTGRVRVASLLAQVDASS
ncbi:MAG TPA: restriction endonuclease subunit S [Candidatus Competibacter sp.]|nr:restriction endonuclease subunit S [Candidatus Competibacter sp.]